MGSPREEKKVDIAKIEEFKRHVKAKEFKQAITLLSGGVDVNTPIDENKRNILQQACYCDEPMIVEQLLIRGAAIDAKDIYGSSAMHVAAIRSVDCLKLLIAHKGDINSQCFESEERETPLMAAALPLRDAKPKPASSIKLTRS